MLIILQQYVVEVKQSGFILKLQAELCKSSVIILVLYQLEVEKIMPPHKTAVNFVST